METTGNTPTPNPKKRRVAVISPEFPGVAGAGGVGTFTFHLISLIKNIHEVTLILTHPVVKSQASKLKNDLGVNVITFSDLESNSHFKVWQDATDRQLASLYISHFLKKNFFDEVIAPDWEAALFYSIRDKKILGLHKGTRFTIVAHGSTYWVSEGMKHLIEDITPKRYARRVFMEKYSMSNVDSLVSPSRYMREWLKAFGIVRQISFLLNPYTNSSQKQLRRKNENNKISVGFFGRLEERKGIAEFISIAKFLSSESVSIEVVLLGKNGFHRGRNSLDVLNEELQAPNTTILHYDNLTSSEAIAFFQEHGTVVIFPSSGDNLPYTAVESVEAGLVCFARNAGGHPDILDSEYLYESPDEVPELINKFVNKITDVKHNSYSSMSANISWLNYLDSNTLENEAHPTKSKKKVSILVTHYNLGKYLREALGSLRDQTYANTEIIIWDDGSTDEISKYEFQRLKNLYSSDSRFNFFSGENLYLGAARNRLSELASGEVLIFFDADNIALPEMVEKFVDALERSGQDILTCATIPFQDGEHPNSISNNKLNVWMPLGGPVLEGLRENVFGDANFGITKAAFDNWGRFTTDRDTPAEDWALLAKIACAQGLIEVIQEPLIFYRQRADSMLNTTSQTAGLWRVAKSFESLLPFSFQEEIRTLIIPELIGAGNSSQFPVGRFTLYGKFEHLIWKYFPVGSFRRRLAVKFYRFLA
jgi:glycosyltransferase involved in cell wall biosynthesis